MRTTSRSATRQRGVSLLEMIVFIVVVSIALGALLSVYTQSARSNVDPIIRLRLLEAAQSRLDEVIALKYDEATPTGGVPACSSTGVVPLPPACTGNVNNGRLNNVSDFNEFEDNPYTIYQREVRVSNEGNRKLITVTVTAPDGQSLALSAYRYNF